MAVMVVVPELANAYGLHEALILRQLHYWLERATCRHEGRPWVYKSITEWAAEFSWWSRSTVHKLLTDLAHDEIVAIRVADGRTYYSINYNNLRKECRDSLVMLSENRTMPSENRTMPSENRTAHNKEYTENTTETTTEAEREIAANAAPPANPAQVPAKPKRSRKPKVPPSSDAPPQREPTEWQEFVGAFCWLCHGHKEVRTLTKDRRGAVLSEAKAVHDDGYTVKDLKEWYKQIWPQSWQWKKDRSRPNPADVRSSIAQLRAETPEGFEVATTVQATNGYASKTDRKREAFANVEKTLAERGFI